MKINQKLPESQKEIILNALRLYSRAIRIIKENNETLEYLDFDIRTLKALVISGDVNIELSLKDYEDFSARHGVDYLEYN